MYITCTYIININRMYYRDFASAYKGNFSIHNNAGHWVEASKNTFQGQGMSLIMSTKKSWTNSEPPNSITSLMEVTVYMMHIKNKSVMTLGSFPLKKTRIVSLWRDLHSPPKALVSLSSPKLLLGPKVFLTRCQDCWLSLHCHKISMSHSSSYNFIFFSNLLLLILRPFS